MQKIDYAKLLGFAAVSKHLSEGVDFKDETLAAKLGAKVWGARRSRTCLRRLNCVKPRQRRSPRHAPLKGRQP
jgi:hypothetical protein